MHFRALCLKNTSHLVLCKTDRLSSGHGQYLRHICWYGDASNLLCQKNISVGILIFPKPLKATRFLFEYESPNEVRYGDRKGHASGSGRGQFETETRGDCSWLRLELTAMVDLILPVLLWVLLLIFLWDSVQAKRRSARLARVRNY